MFLHEALVDGLQSGDTGIQCASFARDYHEMAKTWPDGSLSTLEQQFLVSAKHHFILRTVFCMMRASIHLCLCVVL